MKKVLLGISLAALTLVLTASGLGAGEKIQFKLNLQKGKSYNIREVREQEISRAIQGQKQDMVQTISMGYTFEVEDLAADGTASVKTTYHSCAIKMDGPNGKLEYDSANPTVVDNPMLKVFAALAGQDFRMKITPAGRVSDVTGMQAIMARLLEKLEIPDGPQRQAVESNFKNQFGDQTIKEMMDNMFSIYPDQPVGIGDSWTRKSVISHGYPMIIDNTWTLKDRQGGRAVIEMNSLIKPNPGAAPMEIGSMKLRQEFTGGSKGTMELDEATGWMKSAKMDQQLSGELTVEGNPQNPEGMTIPMTLKTAITVESF